MKFHSALLTVFLGSCIFLGSCSKKNSDTIITPIDSTKNPTDSTKKMAYNDDTTLVASYAAPYHSDSSFSSGVRLGNMDKDTLVEASGLCASRKYPGCFWVENDSKNPNDIYLVDGAAHIRAILHIANSTNRDWEDICIGPGPIAGVNYIYIGEIGDNNNANASSIVYRLPEPQDIVLGTSVYVTTANDVTPIKFRYIDGPHNAESLMIDPATKDLYISSKGTGANIYVARYPQPDTLFILKKIGVIPAFTKLTAGDISADGKEILLKNTQEIYYWKRTAGEGIINALMRPPILEPYTIETQGESVCWTVSGDAYYTTSEYNSPTISGLWRYTRK